MCNSSISCKYISASVPDMGDPIAISFSGLKNYYIGSSSVRLLFLEAVLAQLPHAIGNSSGPDIT